MARDILIVDDEADIRLLISGLLEDEGFDTRQAANSDEAFAAISERRPNLVVLDVWLQGSRLDGLQILDEIMAENPDLPVVVISGHGSIESAVAAVKKGALDYVEKPFKADRLLRSVELAVETSRLRAENAELRLRAGQEADLVGRSATLNHVRQAINRVAPTGSRVLVTGPPGAGKEVAARLLHKHSRRAGGPFVVLNCATLSPERLESELFGEESAADGNRKIGVLEQAHGGTLFLDEVADMPLETQGKIVRVLQEQTFERVGGAVRVRVDVRVIAASNRDLAAAISNGVFREDLYYRLNVVPVKLPALCERREDIPLLADHFMERSAANAGMAPRRLAEDAMAALQAYDWPGNVRQLRNVVDWLLIMAPGGANEPVRADMLPPEISAVTPPALRFGELGEIMGMPLREAREMFERHYLSAQVNRFGGNISRTAGFVGMERSALHRKLKALGVANAALKSEATAD